MGAMYLALEGDESQNVDRAVAALQEALTVFQPGTAPEDWLRTKLRLSEALRRRSKIRGRVAEGYKEALQSLHDTFEHLDPAEDWPTWYLIASSRAPARHRVRDRDLPRRRGTRSGFWRSRERRASPPSRPFAFGVGAGDGSRS